jgi:hypothetical protein
MGRHPPLSSIELSSLRRLVDNYPIERSALASHDPIHPLRHRGFAVWDRAGRWIPTREAIVAYHVVNGQPLYTWPC